MEQILLGNQEPILCYQINVLDLDLSKLSKTISHALRHEPHVYGLKLDEHGWVNLSDLVESLKAKNLEWKKIGKDEIMKIISTSDKRRFEVLENKIRAY